MFLVRSWYVRSKQGYSFLDAAMQLGTGIPRVPLLDRDDKTLCLLSQSGLMGIINLDPKNRLGKMAAMTAEELGGTLPSSLDLASALLPCPK